MELEDALKSGDLLVNPQEVKPAGDDDMTALYKEFKDAPDSVSGLRALKQLVRLMK